jgi:hypothetical protein
MALSLVQYVRNAQPVTDSTQTQQKNKKMKIRKMNNRSETSLRE